MGGAGRIILIVLVLLVGGSAAAYFFVPPVASRSQTLTIERPPETVFARLASTPAGSTTPVVTTSLGASGTHQFYATATYSAPATALNVTTSSAWSRSGTATRARRGAAGCADPGPARRGNCPRGACTRVLRSPARTAAKSARAGDGGARRAASA